MSDDSTFHVCWKIITIIYYLNSQTLPIIVKSTVPKYKVSYLLLQTLRQNPTDASQQTASVAVIPYHFQNKNKLVERFIFHQPYSKEKNKNQPTQSHSLPVLPRGHCLLQ